MKTAEGGLGDEADAEGSSYLDYEAVLAVDFDKGLFANSLVAATNNPDDCPPDLATPLARVSFDAEEVDGRVAALTRRYAEPMLEYAIKRTAAAKRIVAGLDSQFASLQDAFSQLHTDVIDRHGVAAEVHLVATRTWSALWLGRAVTRCLQLTRQLELQYAEMTSLQLQASAQPLAPHSPSTGLGSAAGRSPSLGSVHTPTAALRSARERVDKLHSKEQIEHAERADYLDGGKAGKGDMKSDHDALVRCAHTILSLRDLLGKTHPGEEGHGLDRVLVVRAVRDGILATAERGVRESAERIVREFSVPASASFSQADEVRFRTVSALDTLYILSAPPRSPPHVAQTQPQLLIRAVELYVQASLQSSLASLSRSLAQLPTLDRTLAEISARCQNVMALELILEHTRPPKMPGVDEIDTPADPHEAVAVAAALASGAVPNAELANDPHLDPDLAADLRADLDEDDGDALAPQERQGHKRELGQQNSNQRESLLRLVLTHIDSTSLASYFWRTIASGLAARVQEVAGRGGAAGRALRASRDVVAEAVREAVKRGGQVSTALKAEEAGEGVSPDASRWDREVGVMVGAVLNNLSK